MNADSRIFSEQASAEDNDPFVAVSASEVHRAEFDEPAERFEPRIRPVPMVPTVVAIGLILAWIAAALWLTANSLSSLAPTGLVEFFAALCGVPALIGIAWLAALRTSHAEARRFGETSTAMRAEATMLERRVAALSEIIERNRLTLADQITAITDLGSASELRFSSLGDQIERVDAHAHSLNEAARSTQSTVGNLIASLANARDETIEVGKLLEQAGLSASGHASVLKAEVTALGIRGQEADAIASGAAQRLAEHMTRMEMVSETAGARLEEGTAEMAGAIDALVKRAADSLDDSRRDIAAQGDAMLAMVGAHRDALDSAARESADALANRIGGIEETIDRMAARLDAQRIAGDAIFDDLEQGLERVDHRLDALHAQGIDRSQLLAASISALGGSADAMTSALEAGDAMATRTIGTTETLLIALDAAAREIDETLPDALNRLEDKVAGSRVAVGQAKPELLALVTAAESTHDAIDAIAGVIGEQRDALDRLSATMLDTLSDGRTKVDALGHMVDETITRAHVFTEDAAPRLVEALLRVRETASVAADKARETLSSVIPEAANALEGASAEAMRRATNDTVERQIHAITDATRSAVDATTAATERLAEHIRTISDQTLVVENRLEAARSEQEESKRETFAKRVSLLIEALNSASIDIGKILRTDVSDSAWAAYLKGDRGVFTRRAVRLLDTSDMREVANLYDDDSSFRDQVNRYIHDFESMLRTILAEREGSPLGVTLLSSDMGKLYVALAQAIERLR